MTFEEISKDAPYVAGMTLLPWKALTYKNMDDWMVGLRVTIGLSKGEDAETQDGYILEYDSKGMKIEIVGGKAKRFSYSPKDIALKTYQFRQNVMLREDPEAYLESKLESEEVRKEREANAPDDEQKKKRKPKKIEVTLSEADKPEPAVKRKGITKRSPRKPRAPKAETPAPTPVVEEKPAEEKPDMAAQMAEKAKARAAEKRQKKASKDDDIFGMLKRLGIKGE